MNVQPIYETNECEVVDFLSKRAKLNQVEVKRNKDGSIKKTVCNKIYGEDSEVFPFYTDEEIASMINEFKKDILTANTEKKRLDAGRNLLAFIIGINIGLRGNELLTLKWKDVFDDSGEFLNGRKIMPKKTRRKHKYVTLVYNETIKEAFRKYVAEFMPVYNMDDYIFLSQKGGAISVSAYGKILKKKAEAIGIKQNINTHSMRKTYGYHMWHKSKNKTKALSYLQIIFGHENTKVTEIYIGITKSEVEDFCNSINIGQW